MELPALFEERTKYLLGDEFAILKSALETSPPVSIRVNDKNIHYTPSEEKVPWCENGYYLKNRPLFTADPLFHAGVYYVQEASSMFLAQIVQQFLSTVETVLDLCAAPGGKTTLISQQLPKDALLVSNEVNRSRAMILAENVKKWGNPNVIVTNEHPSSFQQLPGFFDAMVVDAPCSGEGMFRKDPHAIEEWSIHNVEQCVIRQQKILTDVWDTLKSDGILVYSTCTYNREENEENIQWLCESLGAELLRPAISSFDGIVQTDYGIRFYPHKVAGEGFFLSVVRKTSQHKHAARYKDEGGQLKICKSLDVAKHLLQPADYLVIDANLQLVAYARKNIVKSTRLNKVFNCLVNGVVMFDIKGSIMIPNYQFALSKTINSKTFNQVELDLPTAISFLKKENIFLPDAPKGYLLVTFQEQALGWVKNLGNRCNNLYPQHWRIRMHL